MALAEYLGLSKLSDEDWKGSPAIAARLRAKRRCGQWRRGLERRH
jgi:hypothetical protein